MGPTKRITATYSARYFMALYGGESLSQAAEVAAHQERQKGGLIVGRDEYCKIPVDIRSIAQIRGIKSVHDLPNEATEDGLFTYSPDGPEIGLNRTKADRRIRFTLAHEICHQIFIARAKHQIGLLNKSELAAENKICEMFASALLMPRDHIRRFVSLMPNGTPWEAMEWLEGTARKFEVSIPALISRMGEVRSQSGFSGVVLYLRHTPNAFTKLDPCLRVQTCAALGKAHDMRTWYNRSAAAVGLKKPDTLLDRWSAQLGEQKERTGGRYTLNELGDVVRATADTLDKWGAEKVVLSVLRNGRWVAEEIPMDTVHCLYASKGWDKQEAYLVSIMKRNGET